MHTLLPTPQHTARSPLAAHRPPIHVPPHLRQPVAQLQLPQPRQLAEGVGGVRGLVPPLGGEGQGRQAGELRGKG